MFETLSLDEPRPGVHRVRLDRPSRLNAINGQMIEELKAAADELTSVDPRAVVVGSVGRRSFSVGMDTDAPIVRTADPATGESISRESQAAMNGFASLPVPVVAAITGFTLGGGLEFALTADVRIGGESSVYGMPEITQGLIPAAGATQRLPSVVGRSRAFEMMFTGEKYDAAKMADWGLLSAVVDDEAVTEAALNRAEKLGQTEAETDENRERVLDPDAPGTSRGFVSEQSGFGRAISRDPLGSGADDDQPGGN